MRIEINVLFNICFFSSKNNEWQIDSSGKYPTVLTTFADFHLTKATDAFSIPKKYQNKLDSSCKSVIPPQIPNGRFIRLRSGKQSKGKPYILADYKCNRGYELRGQNLQGVLFCRRKKWTGQMPQCVLKGFTISQDFAKDLDGSFQSDQAEEDNEEEYEEGDYEGNTII